MNNITLSNEQNTALKSVLDWYADPDAPQEFYFAGFAGVGKSTIANVAIDELEEKHGCKKVRTAAFTGKAAQVLRNKGVKSAQTIHSLIYVHEMDEETGKITWKLSQDSEASNADLIVLDECSMVDEEMAKDLRSFGKKILVMGDPGQLPPVKGAGAFTNREPDVFLREIHRQAAESPIIELATLARQGKPLPVGYSRNGVRVLGLNKDTQDEVYNKDSQPICGLNRVRWVYTQRIRKKLGYIENLMGEPTQMPVKGERLLCCKNNRKEGFFNGSLGTLERWSVLSADDTGVKPYRFDVKFDDMADTCDKLVVDPYLFAQHFNSGAAERSKWYKGRARYEEFDWGYVLTCHKAQGSSWENVTVIDDSQAFRENSKEWLYTALTRAETGLTVLMRQ